LGRGSAAAFIITGPAAKITNLGADQLRRKMMEFLLTHWHCIVPVIAIAAVLFLRGRNKKRDTEE
jgi:hypothetical protein